MKLMLMLSSIFFALKVFAVEGLPTAEDIVATASKGRIEFLKIVGESEPRIPLIEGKAQLEPYIKIIPSLEKIAIDLNFETFGGDPLKGYKTVVSTAAVKWADIANDDLELIKIILLSANSRTTLLFLEVQNDIFVKLKTNKESFYAAALRMGQIDQFVKSQVKDIEVRSAFRDHQADIFAVLLSQNTFNIEQVEQLMSIAYGPNSFQALLDYLFKNIYLVESGIEIEKIIGLAIKTKHWLDTADFIVQSYLLDLPGYLVLTAVDKSLNSQGAMSEEVASSLMGILSIRQMDEMAQKLVYNSRDRLNEDQIPFLIALASKLQIKLQQYAMLKTVNQLEDFIVRMFLIKKLTSKVEGIYSLKLGTYDFIMTVVRTQKSDMAVNLWSQYVSFGMYYSYYDRTRNVFIVTRFPKETQTPSIYNGQNFTVEFAINNKNQIYGIFVNGAKIEKLLATKIQNIKDYIDLKHFPKSERPTAEGLYVGKVGSYFTRLVINKVGFFYNGSMSFYDSQDMKENHRLFNMGFNNVYFQNWNGALYMTTGELESLGFQHGRGQLKNGIFEGFLFRGNSKSEERMVKMNLKKIN